MVIDRALTVDIPAKQSLRMLDDFRKEGYCTDIDIKIGCSVFPCHRNILASSSTYFQSLFSGRWSNAKELSLDATIDEITFEEVLSLMYLKEIKVNKENASSLLVACVFFDISGVEEVVTTYIRQNFPIDDAFTLYIFASSRGDNELTGAISSYIRRNFHAIYKQESLVKLEMDDLLTILDRSAIVYKEETELLDAVLRWIKCDYDRRNIYLDDFMRRIDIMQLNPAVLVTVVSELYRTQIPNDALLANQLSQYFKDRERCGHDASLKVVSNDMIYCCEGDDPLPDYFTENKEHDAYDEEQYVRLILDDPKISALSLSATRNYMYYLQSTFANRGSCATRISFQRFRVPLSADVLDERVLLTDDMPAPRVVAPYHRMAASPGYVYLYNSINKPSVNSLSLSDSRNTSTSVGTRECSILRYNEETGNWAEVPTMKKPRFSAAIACRYNNLYVVGGGNCFSSMKNPYSTAVEFYDNLSGQWYKLPKKSIHIREGSACVLDRNLYVMSHKVGPKESKLMEAFDMVAGKWRTCNFPSDIRENCSLIPVNGKVWAVGGRKNGIVVKSYHSYNPSTNAYSFGSNSNFEDSYIHAAAVGENLLRVNRDYETNNSI